MTPERLARLRTVVSGRQFDLTLLLENVHDPHNIAAVIRTCDAVGIQKIHLLFTDPRLQVDIAKRIGHRSSAGARKWVEVEVFTELTLALDRMRASYDRILAAAWGEGSTDLFDLDLMGSSVLVFGNEHDGISEDLRLAADGLFAIPQIGMVQSLNISVACAVTLYEALRQRRKQPKSGHWGEKQQKLLETYLAIHRGETSFIIAPEDEGP